MIHTLLRLSLTLPRDGTALNKTIFEIISKPSFLHFLATYILCLIKYFKGRTYRFLYLVFRIFKIIKTRTHNLLGVTHPFKSALNLMQFFTL